MTLIKAVLFDFDRTLLDRDASVSIFVATQYERLKASLSHIPKERYISRFIELDDRGYVWKDKVYTQLVDDFMIKGVSGEQLLEDYESEFHKSCIPYPNLLEMLEQLKRAQVQTGIITNGHGEFQLRNIQALGIDDYVNVILISEWEGIKKPDPEIFLRALARLGVRGEEAMYIGDHPINDVQASRRVGMKAVWKTDSQWEAPKEADGTISDLLDIPDLLNRFNRTELKS